MQYHQEFFNVMGVSSMSGGFQVLWAILILLVIGMERSGTMEISRKETAALVYNSFDYKHYGAFGNCLHFLLK